MRFLGTAALGAALALAVQPAVRRGLHGFPPLSELPSTPYSLQDAALASAGLRSCAADLAWLQLLQYAAGGLPEMIDKRPYEHIGTLSRRVVRLDPSFHRAYLFGAGILAWFHGVDRPDEAVSLLEDGMRDDPGQPSYSIYIAAIAYKKLGDVDRMVALLESTLVDPHSPIETKAILANLYKSRGEYEKALAVWEEILSNENDAREWPRARVQIAGIRRLMERTPNKSGRRDRSGARRGT